ncbi:MAG: hypothetical protein OIN84_01785, partial [Candidatus Methanoperedens sp.]|nr:hypothetical protein [Candidatus Methanoperedens sp.]
MVRRIFVLPNDQLLIVGGRIEAEGANSDVWFWRFDAKAGKPVGERKNITNARFDTGNAIVLRADGGVALAAARKNLGSNSLVGWVARTSAEGAVLWDQQYGEQFDDEFTALTALPDGGVLIG